jgi:hypothetical protein
MRLFAVVAKDTNREQLARHLHGSERAVPRFPVVKAEMLGLTVVALFVFGCSDSGDGVGPGPGPDVPLQVQSLTPTANAVSAGASDDLIVRFDRPLDPGTVSATDVRVFGRWSGVLTQTYGAYAGDLDGDGWSDMILPNEESDDLRVFMNDGTGGYGPF